MRHKRPYAHTAKPSARWQQAAVRPVLTTPRRSVAWGCQFPVRAQRCCVDVHASLAVSTLYCHHQYPYRSVLDAIISTLILQCQCVARTCLPVAWHPTLDRGMPLPPLTQACTGVACFVAG
jgi:hypothetical protein